MKEQMTFKPIDNVIFIHECNIYKFEDKIKETVNTIREAGLDAEFHYRVASDAVMNLNETYLVYTCLIIVRRMQ